MPPCCPVCLGLPPKAAYLLFVTKALSNSVLLSYACIDMTLGRPIRVCVCVWVGVCGSVTQAAWTQMLSPVVASQERPCCLSAPNTIAQQEAWLSFTTKRCVCGFSLVCCDDCVLVSSFASSFVY